MYGYYDDFPCRRCPYNDPDYGHCTYDEVCPYENEENDLDYYLDDYEDDDALSMIITTPKPSDDIDDLLFWKNILGY